MILFSVDGQVKHKKHVRTFVEDILDYFFTTEPKKEINIDIRFVRCIDEQLSGHCSGDREEVHIEVARGIIIDDSYEKYDYEHQMLTLAHELVHAKQFIRGEITAYNDIWRPVGGDTQNCDGMHDRIAPWEVEARRLERELFNLYKEVLPPFAK